MTHNKTRATMTNPIKNILPQGLVGFLFFLVFAGCGPTFDPASLINDTRVVGARIEVEGAPDRASPKPGETANVTWLVTSPDTTPSLGWTFAVCTPATGKSSPACLQAPLVRFDGAASPPRISIPVRVPSHLSLSAQYPGRRRSWAIATTRIAETRSMKAMPYGKRPAMARRTPNRISTIG